MKSFKKSAWCMLVSLILAALCLVSCSKNDEAPAQTTSGDDQTLNANIIDAEYQIVYPKAAKSDDIELFYCKEIRSAINESIGVTLELSSGYVKSGEEVPEKEILIGRTVRDESTAVYDILEENQWTVTSNGSKIIIAGSTDGALSRACEYFINNFIEGKTAIEMENNFNHTDTANFVAINWQDGQTVEVACSGGYPRLYVLKDGTMLLGYDGMKFRKSSDGGLTWSSKEYIVNRPLPGESGLGPANCAFYQTDDGTLYCAYRITGMTANGYYAAIRVCTSTNGGTSWSESTTIYETLDPADNYGGVWEPHFWEIDGILTVFFCNDSRELGYDPHYQDIVMMQLIDGQWTNYRVVANGLDHLSRDGMPVWQQLKSGTYVCVLEGWVEGGSRLIIQLMWSEDGYNWSTPVDIYNDPDELYTGAPYVVEIEQTGQLVVSFQRAKPDGTGQDFVAIVSDGTPVQCLTESSFSELQMIFETPSNTNCAWGGMYIYNNKLYATCVTNYPSNCNRINIIDLEQLLK